MLATRAGECRGCQQDFEVGVPIFWSRDEGAWHWACWEQQEQPAAAYKLAELLKFKDAGTAEETVKLDKEWEF